VARPPRPGLIGWCLTVSVTGFIRKMVIILTCLVVLAACGKAQSANRLTSPTTTTTAPRLPGGYGLTPPDPSLTDRIVLKSSRVTAGHPIDGTLQVFNHGAAAINLTKTCLPSFVVALTNSKYRPQVAFTTACSGQPLVIASGTTRLPVKVITTYLGCHQSGPPSIEPKCLSSGPPPLPAGSYDAVMVGSGDLALPEPQPVPVILTRGTN
jgi:hypothetical protein